MCLTMTLSSFPLEKMQNRKLMMRRRKKMTEDEDGDEKEGKNRMGLRHPLPKDSWKIAMLIPSSHDADGGGSSADDE